VSLRCSRSADRMRGLRYSGAKLTPARYPYGACTRRDAAYVSPHGVPGGPPRPPDHGIYG
jgi:hypothetical protein